MTAGSDFWPATTRKGPGWRAGQKGLIHLSIACTVEIAPRIESIENLAACALIA